MTRESQTPAGRPLDANGRPAIESLEDATLEAELSVAAMRHVLDRDDRYQHLLDERRRRELAHA